MMEKTDFRESFLRLHRYLQQCRNKGYEFDDLLSSPLVKFLETRGPGIHHICLEVDDIEREMEELKKRGARMIDEKPRPGAHNTQVAFIHPKSSGGVLIELNQLPEDH